MTAALPPPSPACRVLIFAMPWLFPWFRYYRNRRPDEASGAVAHRHPRVHFAVVLELSVCGLASLMSIIDSPSFGSPPMTAPPRARAHPARTLHALYNQACDRLVETVLRSAKCTDNVSVVLVMLDWLPDGE